MTEKKGKQEMILYKVLLLGNSTVGKTSFLLRFCDDKYDPETLTTVGVDYKKKFIKRHDKKIKLHICDTAGQERFRSIAKNLFKNADGIIIMYDITNKKSFQDIKDWISSIKENVDLEKIGLVISGNKKDLEDKREVSESMRESLEEKQNIKVIETSAKDNKNVDETFAELIDRMEKLDLGIKHQSSYDDEDEAEQNNVDKKSIKITREPTKEKNNGGCCGKKNTK
jgi:small GTP-binding protein